MIYGYARVSAVGESVGDQIKQLRAAGAASIIRETGSGKRINPGLERALAKLKRSDVLMVTRLDQLARSLQDLLHIVETIRKSGAGFRSLADRLIADPSLPHGKLILSVFGSLAAYEQGLFVARTRGGRARAYAAGVKPGPKPKLASDQQAEARKRVAAGEPVRDIARAFKVHHSTISRLGTAAEIAPRRPALDRQTAQAARTFLSRLEGRYPLIEGIVFGSRARGDHRAESDADLAVILKGQTGNRWTAARDMAEIAFDVMQETGVLVDPLPLWDGELKRPETFTNPRLIDTIKREGMRL